MPQSHTTDLLIAPRGRVKYRQQRHDIQNTTKVKQPGLVIEKQETTKVWQNKTMT